MNKKLWAIPTLLAASIALTGCDSDDDNKKAAAEVITAESIIAAAKLTLPESYAFDSQFIDGESSVSYTGQTARNVFLTQLTAKIGGLVKDTAADQDQIVSDLNFFFKNEGNIADDTEHGYTPVTGLNVAPGLKYKDISTSKSLIAKIAGEDSSSTTINDDFIGWNEGSPADAKALVAQYFSNISALVKTPALFNGSEDLPVYVDAYGRDYKQLVQKFITGAVAYSQGTNDYLLTDWANSNTQDGDKPYSSAEHKWDEAFGYFGAARNYTSYTDIEIANGDIKAGDDTVDLRSEVNFNHSTNCAKRDKAFVNTADATDYTAEVFIAFLTGRAILNETAGNELSDVSTEALEILAKQASKTWEHCIAATVVHYINEVTADIDAITANSSTFKDIAHFKDYAKHWSEMKGFALALQFNPNSPFRDGSVADINIDSLESVLTAMGDAPVLANGKQLGIDYQGGYAAYKTTLIEARDTLQEAYGYSDNQAANW